VDSRRAFLGVSAIVFAASAAMTIAASASMATMGEMAMPGGWALSMVWMRMPGQTWLGAAAAFVGMWVVMMVAMMLPSLTPMLWHYGQAVGAAGAARSGRLTAIVGAGYFFVWAVVGTVVFPLGVALAATLMREPALARFVPMVVGVAVLIAGARQQSGWKTRHLAFCRNIPGCSHSLPADAGSAWRHGLRLGLHCGQSCASLTAVALCLGVMDVRVMAAVTAVVTAEHLAPAGMRVARITGTLGVAAGLLLIVRAPWPL
jgi:predicted metal-binding membrane protein